MMHAPPELSWTPLRRSARTVVVVDLVESVRLIEQDEDDTIRRWQAFVSDVVTGLLPGHGGRLVKSLGDGLMIEFEAVPQAIQCAIAMQRAIKLHNHGRTAEQCMWLRIGAHVADVIVDKHDIYGSGVNLAARIATLAAPAEIVVSAEVRDGLVAGLDADVEEIGECYLKHVREPVHAFRIHTDQQHKVLAAASTFGTPPLEPALAIIPFEGRLVSPAHEVVGELIADNIIARLSKSPAIRVISRLSTSLLRTRARSAAEVGALLGANFVVSGTYRMFGDVVMLMVEMADAKTQQVAWAETLRCPLNQILAGEDALADAVCVGIATAISASGVRQAGLFALPTLEGFSLQHAGVVLMHRSSLIDFKRARELLEHLIERYPRAPQPRAWLAKWYVLRVTLGIVEDLSEETGRALDQTRRALDLSPDCSLALAMEGFVHCHMLRDLDGADQRLDEALRVNPNESLAWLYKCVVQGFRNDGRNAMASAERAIELSPLDPMRHYYDGLAASAALAVGSLERAIKLATRSLRVNRTHAPTLRALAIAQVESGAVEAARSTVLRILELEPGLTVGNYIARGPKGAEVTRARYASALREAGVPAA